jgi:hypothetical protein
MLRAGPEATADGFGNGHFSLRLRRQDFQGCEGPRWNLPIMEFSGL